MWRDRGERLADQRASETLRGGKEVDEARVRGGRREGIGLCWWLERKRDRAGGVDKEIQ